MTEVQGSRVGKSAAKSKRIVLFIGIAVFLSGGTGLWLGCCNRKPMSLDDMRLAASTRFANSLDLPEPMVKTLLAAYPGLDVVQTRFKIADQKDDTKNLYLILINYRHRRMLVRMNKDGAILTETLAIPMRAVSEPARTRVRETAAKMKLKTPRFWAAYFERVFENGDYTTWEEHYKIRFLAGLTEQNADVAILSHDPEAGEESYQVTITETRYTRWDFKPLSAIRGVCEAAIRKMSPNIELIGCRYRYKDKTDLYWVQGIDNGVPVHILVDGKGDIKEMEDLRQIAIRY